MFVMNPGQLVDNRDSL